MMRDYIKDPNRAIIITITDYGKSHLVLDLIEKE